MTTFLNGADADGDAATTSHFRPGKPPIAQSSRPASPTMRPVSPVSRSIRPSFAGRPALSVSAIPTRAQHDVVDWFAPPPADDQVGDDPPEPLGVTLISKLRQTRTSALRPHFILGRRHPRPQARSRRWTVASPAGSDDASRPTRPDAGRRGRSVALRVERVVERVDDNVVSVHQRAGGLVMVIQGLR